MFSFTFVISKQTNILSVACFTLQKPYLFITAFQFPQNFSSSFSIISTVSFPDFFFFFWVNPCRRKGAAEALVAGKCFGADLRFILRPETSIAKRNSTNLDSFPPKKGKKRKEKCRFLISASVEMLVKLGY